MTRVLIVLALLALTGCGDSTPSDVSWAGCGVPSRPTLDDFIDCKQWQAEKRAMRRREAEEQAP